MNPVYPSYVDFDQFIDVNHLLSIDGFIAERIGDHIASGADSFFLNQHPLDADAPHAPGVREIWLSKTRSGRPYDYLDIDKPDLWEPSAAAEEFEPLMHFIATLPFAATARILIIYDNGANHVPAHRDHIYPEICHEFIWMRTRFNKRFYMLEPETGARTYVQSHSAWFDSVNQFHGADASDDLSFSIRVDGVFDEELRRQIPYPEFCRSSAPAIMAGQTNQALLFLR